MSSHLTPLRVCEALIGPLEKIGTAAGLTEKAPYRWRRSSANRDAGDIPQRPARRLLAYAAARGIPLNSDHILFGCTVAEVHRLRMTMRANGITPPCADWLTGTMPGVAAQ